MYFKTPIVAVCSLMLAACTQTGPWRSAEPPLVFGNPTATGAAGHASPVVDHLPSVLGVVAGNDNSALKAFYRTRDFTPVWYDDGPFEAARSRAVMELTETGLAPSSLGPDATAAQRAEHEVALTLAALRYDTTAPSGGALGPVAMFDALAAAVAAAAPPAQLPTDTVFGGQLQGVNVYEALVAAGGWPLIPPGPSLEPGSVDARVPSLRARLRVTGEYVGGDEAGERYAPSLVAAVHAFQARHGVVVDGVVGPATLRALNVPAEARLAQLRRAEAKANALLGHLGGRYVLVNIPAFELRYVRAGEVRFQTDVIVGSRDDQTVEFSDEIEHLVFNPYWNVPYSIASEDLIPKFRANPGGMASKGYQVVDAGGTVMSPTAVDWSQVSAANLPYRVRQGPGHGNALGEVKFMFPNQHAIYLHDTPSKALFERSMRALSHGCIRVRDPLSLAERLLEPEGVDRASIDGWVERSYNRYLQLAKPIPVHLVYVTAWVDPDGTVQFRNDIYGRDGV